MLFESPNIRVTAEHGTATLWLGFPGGPVNALDLDRFRELDEALTAIGSVPSVRILVVRSALPTGFCAGLHPRAIAEGTHPSERAAFAWFGQRVCERLSGLDAVSVAHIDGACLGAGFELALACDYRVCVARPTTHLGFPDRFACFGGNARVRLLAGRRGDQLLASGRSLSGREAVKLRLVDVACCERRAKIELRTFLDRLEKRPVKRRAPTDLAGLAAERRDFAARACPAIDSAPVVPGALPDTVGILGDDENAARFAVDVVLRGGSAVVCGNRAGVFGGIEIALARGFITLLEAEETRRRVRTSDSLAGFDRADVVFVGEGSDPFRLAAVVRPRTVICVIGRSAAGPVVAPRVPAPPFPFPRRLVRLSFCDRNRVALFPDALTDPETPAAVAAWLKPFGFTSLVFPVQSRLLPRAA